MPKILFGSSPIDTPQKFDLHPTKCFGENLDEFGQRMLEHWYMYNTCVRALCEPNGTYELIAGRICNNFLVDCALFDKSMKLGTGVDL